MTKSIVVTGTSSGLGEQLFRLIVESDCALLAISRSFSTQQSNAANESRGRIRCFQCDLSEISESHIEGIGIAVQDFRNPATVFINNASVIEPIAGMGNLSPGLLKRNIDTNFSAPIQIANALVRAATSSGMSLKVVNVTSGSALRAIEGWAAYCSTKAAVRMAFDVGAKENAFELVHFEPGTLDTKMQQTIRTTDAANLPSVARFRALYDAGMLKSPEEVAETMLKEHVF
jgi:benzil reductase ((S)-benzoin forming)